MGADDRELPLPFLSRFPEPDKSRHDTAVDVRQA